MRPAVHFLNVGWGDAHLIRMPSGSVTLIDGGDGLKSAEQDHPLDWMRRNGVDTIDWMILTHIHEDHLNGLLDIAGSIKVLRAVLPYELPLLPGLMTEEEAGQGVFGETKGDGAPLPSRVRQMLGDYLQLIGLLTRQGTEIRWRSEFASDKSSALWEEDGFKLLHLYPWQGDPEPGFELLSAIAARPDYSEEERMTAYAAFFPLSNNDSSVYRLVPAGDEENGILFGGDQTEAGWDILSARTKLKSRIWKVPHHGMQDSFTLKTIIRVSPDFCIIPISLARSSSLRNHWDSLNGQALAAIRLTGEAAPGRQLPMPDVPFEVWIGG